MWPGNGELENESGLLPKLQKAGSGSDVNAAGSLSREDYSGATAEVDPIVQKSQEVELEVVIEDMPKWTFLRVNFVPSALF